MKIEVWALTTSGGLHALVMGHGQWTTNTELTLDCCNPVSRTWPCCLLTDLPTPTEPRRINFGNVRGDIHCNHPGGVTGRKSLSPPASHMLKEEVGERPWVLNTQAQPHLLQNQSPESHSKREVSGQVPGKSLSMVLGPLVWKWQFCSFCPLPFSDS